AKLDGKITSNINAGLHYIGSASPQEPFYIPFIREVKEYKSSQFSKDAIKGLLFGGRAGWNLSKTLSIEGEANIGIPDTLDNNGDTKRLRHAKSQEIALSLSLANKIYLFSNSLKGTYVAPHYYSGGNPTLTKDMIKLELMSEASVIKDLPLNLNYFLNFENRSFRNYYNDPVTEQKVYDPDSCDKTGPLTRHRFLTIARYNIGNFNFGINYDFSYEYNEATEQFYDTAYFDSAGIKVDVPDSSSIASVKDTLIFYNEREMRNMPGVDFQHIISQRFSYKIEGKILAVNDLNDNPLYRDYQDAFKWQVKAGMKINPLVRLKNSFDVRFTRWKRENDGNYLNRYYEITEKLMVDIIKRKLKLNLYGYYKGEREFEWRTKMGENHTDKTHYSDSETRSQVLTFNVGLKYIISSSLALNLSYTRETRYNQRSYFSEQYEFMEDLINIKDNSRRYLENQAWNYLPRFEGDNNFGPEDLTDNYVVDIFAASFTWQF
ncbi:MAG: hypothetical protein ABIA63_06700, partial [bacterium]